MFLRHFRNRTSLHRLILREREKKKKATMHTRSSTIYTGYHGNIGKEESNYVFKYKKGRVREPSAGKKKGKQL